MQKFKKSDLRDYCADVNGNMISGSVIAMIKTFAMVTVFIVITVSCSFEWREYAQDDTCKPPEAKHTYSRPSHLSRLPAEMWIKIHEQHRSDNVYFKRQAHGGSAFDTRRGKLILFGSDTHGKDWSNTPYIFDPEKLSWSRLYPNDDPGTYHVNAEGVPVAGVDGNHPWAMHTFGAVTYHQANDELVVSSYPAHMRPGRFSNVFIDLWPQIKQHKTWILALSNHRWRVLEKDAVHFFPYATTYDTERSVVIGYKKSGIYELAGQPPAWKQTVKGGLLGYSNNVVYDSWCKALIAFGSNEKSNDVVVYRPATKQHLIMPTPGIRPPKDRHNPMAFHPQLGKTVVLVDNELQNENLKDRLVPGRSETWLYDLKTDNWTRVTSAEIPFTLGMNYNMEYDSVHDVLLLVTNAPETSTSVWALRFEP